MKLIYSNLRSCCFIQIYQLVTDSTRVNNTNVGNIEYCVKWSWHAPPPPPPPPPPPAWGGE